MTDTKTHPYVPIRFIYQEDVMLKNKAQNEAQNRAEVFIAVPNGTFSKCNLSKALIVLFISDGSSCVKSEKREPQTFISANPAKLKYLIIDFRKLHELPDTDPPPPILTSETCG